LPSSKILVWWDVNDKSKTLFGFAREFIAGCKVVDKKLNVRIC